MLELKYWPTLNVDVKVLEVRAVDGDRGINTDINYSITGGPTHLFGINQHTGLVYSKVKLVFN